MAPPPTTTSPGPGCQVSVVLPTYNEAENLPILVPRILQSLGAAGIAAEVIVVDDDSPDGTAKIAEALGKDLPVRVCLRQGERGLATAVLRGFDLSTAAVCVVMDADGSHPPEQLPALVMPVLRGEADAAVGSRNVPGGDSVRWPWYRKVVSKTAAAIAGGLTTLSDPTSGFMAIRRERLAGVALSPVGWKIVLEIVVKARIERLVEVPIVFHDRVLGQSKMSLREQWNYLRHLGRLYRFRHPTLEELAKFCLVGLTGVAVDMGVVFGVKELTGADTRLCAVLGFLAAVTTNFLLNRAWSFKGARAIPWLRSYLAFVTVCGIGLAVRLGVMHLLIEYTELDRGRSYLWINFIGIVVATLVNFAGSKNFAFSKRG